MRRLDLFLGLGLIAAAAIWFWDAQAMMDLGGAGVGRSAIGAGAIGILLVYIGADVLRKGTRR